MCVCVCVCASDSEGGSRWLNEQTSTHCHSDYEEGGSGGRREGESGREKQR